MSGDSGLTDTMNQYAIDNDALTQMENHFRNQSLNTLNNEMVRTQAEFGFGKRPEPKPINDNYLGTTSPLRRGVL